MNQLKGKFGQKKLLKIFLILLSVLSMSALIIYFFFNPYRDSVSKWEVQNITLDQVLTKEQAIEDLEFLKEKYETIHYLAIDGLSEGFLEQYEYEIENLSDSPTMLEVWQAASRITHTLGDGHSQVNCALKEDYYDVPYSISDGIVYINIEDERYKVIEINGVSIEQIKENAYKLLSYENDIYKEYKFLLYIGGSKHYLRLLGSSSFEKYTVSYEKDGKIQTNQFEPKTVTDSAKKDFVFYEIDKENDVGILTLNECEYNDHYKAVLEKFFTQVKENKIRNIAVDLRNNGGGSSFAANEFIRYLKVDRVEDYTSSYRIKYVNGKSPFHKINNKKKNNLLYEGNVYVLTSPATFSSAMNFSVLLQDNGLAKVIGEPCGNKPSQYGEVVTFLMPNTKLYFNSSIAYFERPNKELTDELYQEPDYYIESDKAIEKLYEIIK